MQIAGVRLWLDDGTTREIVFTGKTLEQIKTEWSQMSWAGSRGIIYLAAYSPQTYLIYINGVQVEENYLVHLELTDYFWYDPDLQEFGAGSQADVPATIPNNMVKRGKLVLEDAWRSIYNVAYESRRAPVAP